MRFRSKYKKSGWTRVSLFRRNMIVCMITSHKVRSFVLGQLGTNSARETENIFLNLENSNKKKSTVRKVFNREGKLTTDPIQIMNEWEVFYSDLYGGSTSVDTGSFSSFLSHLNEIPFWVEEKKNVCEANWDTESVTMLCRPSKRINHPETTA